MNNLKELSLKELQLVYKEFLNKQNIAKLTIDTASVDAFYLWRKEGKDLFWSTAVHTDFENVARHEIKNALLKNSKGNIKALTNSYLSHLRRFCKFLNLNTSLPQVVIKQKSQVVTANTRKYKVNINVPTPSTLQVEDYLIKWDNLENYSVQEQALNKLFNLLPNNTNITDILIKAATLNNFYSTNIFWIYPVAKHINNLNIDARLKAGDDSLVQEIQRLTISGKQKSFYSFASKYCSHHNPKDYPIYDSYVDNVLWHFKNCDNFFEFKRTELKDYVKFKKILKNFCAFYKLNNYDFKQIDKYLWQLGKSYFPKKYSK